MDLSFSESCNKFSPVLCPRHDTQACDSVPEIMFAWSDTLSFDALNVSE